MITWFDEHPFISLLQMDSKYFFLLLKNLKRQKIQFANVIPTKLLSPYHQKIRPCNDHVIPWKSFYSFITDELQVFFSIIEKLKWQKIRSSNMILIKLLHPYHHKIRSRNDHLIRWTSFYFFYCRWTPSDFFYYWKAWNGKKCNLQTWTKINCSLPITRKLGHVTITWFDEYTFISFIEDEPKVFFNVLANLEMAWKATCMVFFFHILWENFYHLKSIIFEYLKIIGS